LLFSSPAEPLTESSDEYIFKTIVESRLEERLFYSLSEIAGTDKLIVIASANVRTLKLKKANNVKRKKKTLVLPGVPVKKEIGKQKAREIDLTDMPPSMITRLHIIVLTDNSVPDATIDIMRDVAIAVSGYNPDRGDVIDIKQIDFNKGGFSWADLLHPPHMYWIILVTLGSVLILAAASFLFNPYRKLSSAFRSINWEVIRGAPPSETQAGEEESRAEAAIETVKVEQEKTTAFSFVSERRIPELAFLLENRPALDAAVVVNYLSPEFATRLLEHFNEDKQAEISLMLSSGEVIKPEKVQEIEADIKTKLDYVMGGENKLAPILNLASDDIREKVMDMIESKDEETAMRLRKKVKGFDDIMRGIPAHNVQVLYRRLNPTVFAQVLKSSPVDIQERVLGALSEGASERMKEEMELSHPLTPNRLRKERNSIITNVRHMVNAGLIEEIED
jgi:flagellar motor switch protein FliG